MPYTGKKINCIKTKQISQKSVPINSIHGTKITEKNTLKHRSFKHNEIFSYNNYKRECAELELSFTPTFTLVNVI